MKPNELIGIYFILFVSDVETISPNPLETPTVSIVTEVHIKDTLDFVRSFILLDSLYTSGNQISKDTNENCATKHNNMILKSLVSLFEFLKSEGGLKMEFKIVNQALTEIHKLFDTPFGKLNSNLVDICLTFLDDLLLDIHRTLEINKVL